MYVGFMDYERERQLFCLDYLIMGYTCALRQHQIIEPVSNFREELGVFLRQKHGWSMSQGPIAAILRVSSTEESAWALFWESVWDFERSLTNK